MGQLVDGIWHDEWYDTESTGGRFQRSVTAHRNWVTPDGSPGPSGEGGFAAESGRYHLYVSYACPWAHRTLIFRALKGLEPHIDISVVHPDMLSEGWTFDTDFPGATGDRQFGLPFLRDVYLRDTPDMSGRVTVPVLWDKQTGRIVSNESAEIIRMFNSAFDAVTGNSDDYWPERFRDQIETFNTRIYDTVNNGVYKAGFAASQQAYDAAVKPLFAMLDKLEERLEGKEWLVGDQFTEADLRLWTTLIRFDPVYVTHFKCNIRRIADYPNLSAFTRLIYEMNGMAETVNFKHIKHHYFESHLHINPTGIVPAGPDPLVPGGRV